MYSILHTASLLGVAFTAYFAILSHSFPPTTCVIHHVMMILHVFRKAVRATLILIPLLGLQYILFPFEPEKGTMQYEVYRIASAIVTSYQVSALNCLLINSILFIICFAKMS